MRGIVAIALWHLLVVIPRPCLAEVIAIDPIETGFLYSSDKTRTFLWEAKDAGQPLY